MQQLKNKASKGTKHNKRDVRERCDEPSLWWGGGGLFKANSCMKRVCVRGRATVHTYTIHGGYFVIVCRLPFHPCNVSLNRQSF